MLLPNVWYVTDLNGAFLWPPGTQGANLASTGKREKTNPASQVYRQKSYRDRKLKSHNPYYEISKQWTHLRMRKVCPVFQAFHYRVGIKSILGLLIIRAGPFLLALSNTFGGSLSVVNKQSKL